MNLLISLLVTPITPSLGKNNVIHECVREDNPRIVTPCSSKVQVPTSFYHTILKRKPILQ